MSYTQIALSDDAGLYQWQPSGQIGTDDGWSGYLLTQGAGLVPELDAGKAWKNYWGSPLGGENGGIYVFCKNDPEDYDDLLLKLLAYIEKLNSDFGADYRYLVWIKSPNAKEMGCHQIGFYREGEENVGKVFDRFELPVRNIKFVVDQNITIHSDDAVPSLSLKQFGSAEVSLLNTIGTAKTIGKVMGDTTVVIDGCAGQLQMKLQISATTPSGSNDLRTMRTGVQYSFYDDDHWSGELCPVLNKTDKSDVVFAVLLSSLRPEHVEKTSFTFVANDNGDAPPTFESYIMTDLGHTVNLTPVAGSSGFVLLTDMYPWVLKPKEQSETYYFAPTGQFNLSYQPPIAPPAGQDIQLMCGLASTETISAMPANEEYEGDVLTFHPAKPAFAPVYPLPAVNLAEPNSPSISDILLNGDFKTSWVTVTRNEEPSAEIAPLGPNLFYSQPHGASLYSESETKSADGAGPAVLDFFQTKLADLTSNSADRSYPFVPYLGAPLGTDGDGFDAKVSSRFESEIISPTRKSEITNIKAAAGDFDRPAKTPQGVTTVPATTPQGLLAQIADDGTGKWDSLLLAHNVDGGTAYNLQFSDVHPVLQDAFQTNQQFLVVTQPKSPWNAGTGTIFENSMRIEDWPFNVNTGSGNVPGDYANVLIFKFVDGKLSEHVKNPSNWTSAAQFNDTEAEGLAFLSQWLQDYIEQAKEMAESEKKQGTGESYFEKFIEIVESDTWNGILALKVDIGVADFPDALKGLLGGIDLASFNAHHLGVDVNFIQATSGPPEVAGNSSLFGLVYYVDAAYQSSLSLGGDPDRPVQAAPGDFDFKVLTLKVLFENTAVRNFESKLQVTANKWFGDTVLNVVEPDGTAVDIPSNSIILDGAYEEHDGGAAFTFMSKSERLFLLNSNVLGVVEAAQAQFVTLTGTGGENSDTVKSRIVFTGYMNFRPNYAKLEEDVFDLFSFGSEWENGEPGRRQGLYFSNLLLGMEFAQKTPSDRIFTLDTDVIALNRAQSVPRDDSFFKNFPLKIVGLSHGTSGKLPEKLGFLPVSMPKGFQGVGRDWYALEFTLSLGTAGDLAESAGLVATLMAAWSIGGVVDTPYYEVFVGLSLPGTGGSDAKMFSLQNVIKLSIDDVELLVGETEDSPPRKAYLLKMTQLALKFFMIKLPPSGNTVFFLFGDPNPDSPQSNLGWYAAYNKEKKPGALTGAGEVD